MGVTWAAIEHVWSSDAGTALLNAHEVVHGKGKAHIRREKALLKKEYEDVRLAIRCLFDEAEVERRNTGSAKRVCLSRNELLTGYHRAHDCSLVKLAQTSAAHDVVLQRLLNEVADLRRDQAHPPVIRSQEKRSAEVQTLAVDNDELVRLRSALAKSENELAAAREMYAAEISQLRVTHNAELRCLEERITAGGRSSPGNDVQLTNDRDGQPLPEDELFSSQNVQEDVLYGRSGSSQEPHSC